MASSYRLLGADEYIDSNGIAHNQTPLNDILNQMALKNIFFWSGDHSDNDPEGITVWNKALELARTEYVLVWAPLNYGYHNAYSNSFIVVIGPSDVAEIESLSYKQFNGALIASSNYDSSSLGTAFRTMKPSMRVMLSEGIVTEVWNTSIVETKTKNFLPTDSEMVTSFIPTYDYHPATKKYVDDNVKIITPDNTSTFLSDLNVLSGIGYQKSGQLGEVFNDIENNDAAGEFSHAEGYRTEASGQYSHAEGGDTVASGQHGHAEGYGCKAIGNGSHAEGMFTRVDGLYAHAQGMQTIATGDYSHVFGKFNIEDTEEDYVEIVGNGYTNDRSNARTLDWDGNEVLAGKLTLGAGPVNAMDAATKQYVDSVIAAYEARIASLESQYSQIAVDPEDITTKNIWISSDASSANTEPTVAKTATPEFEDCNIYNEITLTCADTDATIYYSIDNQNCDQVYENYILYTTSMRDSTLYFRAQAPGKEMSDINSIELDWTPLPI